MAEANEISCDEVFHCGTIQKGFDKWVEIPKNDVYEVVISKESSAMSAGMN